MVAVKGIAVMQSLEAMAIKQGGDLMGVCYLGGK